MDLKKSFNAAMVPLAVFIGLGIIVTILAYVVPILGLLGLLVLPVNACLVAWAGYKAAKEQKLDLAGGALAGIIVGTIGAIVNAIVGTALSIIFTLTGGLGVSAAFSLGTILVAALIGTIFWVGVGIFGGAILGAAGAYVAGMKK